MSSTLRVNAISDSAGANGNAITLATDGTCTAKVTNNLSNRNKFQNGACLVNQRGTSTGLTYSAYAGPDRWKFVCWNLGTWTVSQDTDVPAGEGFAYSWKMDCTTAQASPPASSGLGFESRQEGINFQDLAYGTSSAKSITISFWIKCNKTGNFQVNWKNNGRSRIISSVQTISSANTWEKKTITFAGDTASSQVIDINTTNNIQLEIRFDGGSDEKGGTAPTSWEAIATTDRAAGVTLALGDSTSNVLYMTGLQIEVGTTATDFEHRSYGDELARCKRYYHHWVDSWGSAETTAGLMFQSYNSTGGHCPLHITPQMRGTPTIKVSNATNAWQYIDGGSSDDFDQIAGNSTSLWTDKNVELYASGNLSTTAGHAAFIRCKASPSTTYLAFDAEL